MIPDVPPRNPTMSRMNGRVPQGIVNDLDMDFEPSCLVRTPSGNVYIPSGNLSEFKRRKNNRIFLAFTVSHWRDLMLYNVHPCTRYNADEGAESQKKSKKLKGIGILSMLCMSESRWCGCGNFYNFPTQFSGAVVRRLRGALKKRRGRSEKNNFFF